MNTTKYLELREERADLTAHGYEIQWGTYENLGQELRDSYEAFLACGKWIDTQGSFEPGWSRYTRKHEVENWVRREVQVYPPRSVHIGASERPAAQKSASGLSQQEDP